MEFTSHSKDIMKIYLIFFCVAATADSDYQNPDSEESNTQAPTKTKHVHRFTDNPIREKVRDGVLNFTLGNRLEELVEKGFHERKIIRRKCHGVPLKCKKTYILPSFPKPLVFSKFSPTQHRKINSTSLQILKLNETLEKYEKLSDKYSTTTLSTIKGGLETTAIMVPGVVNEKFKNANSILQVNAAEVPVSNDTMVSADGATMATTPSAAIHPTPVPVIMKIPSKTTTSQLVTENTTSSNLNDRQNVKSLPNTTETEILQKSKNSLEKVDLLDSSKPSKPAFQSLHNFSVRTKEPNKNLKQSAKPPPDLKLSSARMRTSRSTPTPITQKPLSLTTTTSLKATTSLEKVLFDKQGLINSIDKPLISQISLTDKPEVRNLNSSIKKELPTTAAAVSVNTTFKPEILITKNPKSIITTSKFTNFTTRNPKLTPKTKKVAKNKHKSPRPTGRTTIRTSKLTTTKMKPLQSISTTVGSIITAIKPEGLITKALHSFTSTATFTTPSPKLLATTQKPVQISTKEVTTTIRPLSSTTPTFKSNFTTIRPATGIPKLITPAGTRDIKSTDDLTTASVRTTLRPKIITETANSTTGTSLVLPSAVPSINQPAKIASSPTSKPTLPTTEGTPILSIIHTELGLSTTTIPSTTKSIPTKSSTKLVETSRTTKIAPSTMDITRTQSTEPIILATTAEPTPLATTTVRPLITTTSKLISTIVETYSTLKLESNDVTTISTEATTLSQDTTLTNIKSSSSVSTTTKPTTTLYTSQALDNTPIKRIYTFKKGGSESAINPEIQTVTIKPLQNSSDPARNTVIPDITTESKSKLKKKTKKKNKGFSNDVDFDLEANFDVASTPKQITATSTTPTSTTSTTTLATSTTTKRRKKLYKKRKGFSNNGNTDMDNMWG